MGYRPVWLPGHYHPYWLAVSNVYGIGQQWVLLTNVPIRNAQQAKEIWFNYRRHWGVEDTSVSFRKKGSAGKD